jgi:hypothetical protein
MDSSSELYNIVRENDPEDALTNGLYVAVFYGGFDREFSN